MYGMVKIMKMLFVLPWMILGAGIGAVQIAFLEGLDWGKNGFWNEGEQWNKQYGKTT